MLSLLITDTWTGCILPDMDAGDASIIMSMYWFEEVYGEDGDCDVPVADVLRRTTEGTMASTPEEPLSLRLSRFASTSGSTIGGFIDRSPIIHPTDGWTFLCYVEFGLMVCFANLLPLPKGLLNLSFWLQCLCPVKIKSDEICWFVCEKLQRSSDAVAY